MYVIFVHVFRFPSGGWQQVPSKKQQKAMKQAAKQKKFEDVEHEPLSDAKVKVDDFLTAFRAGDNTISIM